MGLLQDYGSTGRTEKSQKLAGKRILVAEDEGIIAFEIECSIIDQGGDVVGPFSRLEQVLRAIEEHEVDGAVLDIMLGADEVYPAADRLVERAVPVVFHSGHATADRIESDYPGSRLISKPCIPDDLIDALCR